MQLVGKLQSLDRVHGVVHAMSSAYRLVNNLDFVTFLNWPILHFCLTRHYNSAEIFKYGIRDSVWRDYLYRS